MITELRINGIPVQTKILELRSSGALNIVPEASGCRFQYAPTVVTEDNDNQTQESPDTPSSSLITGTYLQSINYISPQDQGQFMIFGDYCTSIVQRTDSSDPQSRVGAHTLAVFDACKACTDCATQRYIQTSLYECLLWLAGLKDCVLYYDSAAQRLWNQMLEKKQLDAVNCQEFKIAKDYRQKQFGKAVKLLYQYKAAVTMWNYLVFTKARSIQVIQTPETHIGFIMQSKRIIDFCDASLSSVTLHMKATLQQGQTNAYLANSGRIMLIYADKVQQNTYIEYGKDTASLGGSLDTGSVSKQIQMSMQPVVDCVLTFHPSTQCRAVFSGSVKVLPVVTQGDFLQGFQMPSTPSIGLAKYAELAYDACDIEKSQLTLTNRWRIQISWAFNVGTMDMTQDDTKQVTYYTSGFGLYPTRSDSAQYIPSGNSSGSGGSGSIGGNGAYFS